MLSLAGYTLWKRVVYPSQQSNSLIGKGRMKNIQTVLLHVSLNKPLPSLVSGLSPANDHLLPSATVSPSAQEEYF